MASEPLGPQQRVGEVDQEAERDGAGERIIEDHGLLPLQPFANVGVADRQGEKGRRQHQHQNVHHGMLLVAPGLARQLLGIPARKWTARGISPSAPTGIFDHAEVPAAA